MAPNFKTHTVLLSVLGKLTINANESQSGDYLTSVTYRPGSVPPRRWAMSATKPSTERRAVWTVGDVLVSEGWEVRTPDVNKEDKWSFAKARSAPHPLTAARLPQ